MTAWWNGHGVGFDIESDSPDPDDARIITACATIIRPGMAPVVHEWVARPERDIPEGATAVHGITTEWAREHGKPRADAVHDIAHIISGASTLCPLICHNAPYDLTVLDRELRRLGGAGINLHDDGLPMFGHGPQPFAVIDTLVLDKQVDRYRGGKGGRKLTAAAPVYGVELTAEQAHAADSDVRASVQMALAIARRCSMDRDELSELYADRRYPHLMARPFHEIRDLDVVELHRAQIEWAAEQAAGLAEWARANPEKTDIDPSTVDGTWPLRWMREEQV
jgi:DNA polymerase III subunit epsilon